MRQLQLLLVLSLTRLLRRLLPRLHKCSDYYDHEDHDCSYYASDYRYLLLL